MRYVTVIAEIGHQVKAVALLSDPSEDQLIEWMEQYLTVITPGYPRPQLFRTAEFDPTIGPEPVLFSQRVWPVTRPATGPWGGKLLV